MLLYACVLLVPDPGRHPSPHVALGHEVGQSDGSVTVGPSVYVSQIQSAILAHTWRWDTKRDNAMVVSLYACELLVPDPERYPSPHVALENEVGQSDGNVTVDLCFRVPDSGRHPGLHVVVGHEAGQRDGSVTVGLCVTCPRSRAPSWPTRGVGTRSGTKRW